MTSMRTVTSVLEFGAQLRAARHAQGLTQAQVAEKANVSRAFVTDVERGKRPAAEFFRVLAVARALGFSLALVPEAPGTFDDALSDLLAGRR